MSRFRISDLGLGFTCSCILLTLMLCSCVFRVVVGGKRLGSRAFGLLGVSVYEFRTVRVVTVLRYVHFPFKPSKFNFPVLCRSLSRQLNIHVGAFHPRLDCQNADESVRCSDGAQRKYIMITAWKVFDAIATLVFPCRSRTSFLFSFYTGLMILCRSHELHK